MKPSRRMTWGAIAAISLLLVGCTAAPGSKEKPSTLVALKLADQLRELDAVQSVDIDWNTDESFRGPVLNVDVDPDVPDSTITKMGKLVWHAADHLVRVDADFTAGDYVWSLPAGLDQSAIASSVIWLRSDPRVRSAHVDSLYATGVADYADVLATASDFYDAMHELNQPGGQRLEIKSSPEQAWLGTRLDLQVAVGQPFPRDAVAAYGDLLDRVPGAGASIAHLEGHYPLTMAVRVNAQTDVVAARSAVTDVVLPLVGADHTRLEVGPVRDTLAEFTDERVPFVRAIVAEPHVFDVAFHGGLKVRVTSIDAWNAAQDVIAANLTEPARMRLIAADNTILLNTVARPAGDPLRLFAALAAGVHSVQTVSVEAPGNDYVTVLIKPGATSADLTAIVQAVLTQGLTDRIRLRLRVATRPDEYDVAKVEAGRALLVGTDRQGLGAAFVTAWNAATEG